MLLAVAARFARRRPAFWECAVTQPTVRLAGHDLGADHLVGAAGNKAWTWTTAVLLTKTLADRGAGAAHYGARLLLVSAVRDAM